MLVFHEKYEVQNPLNVVFLCGSRYGRKDASDKRNVLRSFIEHTLPECHPIILEQNFWFKETNKKYLSYDDIYMNNLAHIEQLAALFAWKIIIVHESISTAAEIGTFAIDPVIAKKMCLLIPDCTAIEEKKLSSFINLGFFSRKESQFNIQEKIIYYPDVKIVKTSPNKSDYYTYFHNNEIGESLGDRIKSFLSIDNTQSEIAIKKTPFNQPYNDENTISFTINTEKKEVQVTVPPKIFMVHLLSLFYDEEFRRGIRKERLIHEHVTFIEQYYLVILQSTIALLSSEKIEGYSIKCKLLQTTCIARQAIGYFIYMLQASKFIGLEQINGKAKQRKITLNISLEIFRDKLSGIIYDAGDTSFGRLNK